MFQQFHLWVLLIMATAVTLPSSMLGQDKELRSSQSATIVGTVQDVNGGTVSNAAVALTGPDIQDERATATNGNGFFEFGNVRPGVPYQITIRAQDFADWTSPVITLGSGQFKIMTGIQLRIATDHTTVNVHYDPVQVATAQFKSEEKQRAFGIIPNFYVAYDQNSEPLTATSAQVKSAQYSYKNARELIVLVVVSNYLLVIADQSQVDSARAQRDTAKALFDQTTDQKKAGLAAAVDLLRSNVELQAREQRLIVARNNLAKQKLVLARAVGLPTGQTFEVTTQVPYQPITTLTLDEALQQAPSSRADYKSLIEQLHSAELHKKAASAERYPTLSALVDYGSIGTNPASNHGTVNAAAVLQIPIFRGGRVHGDNLVADSLLARVRQQLEDLRARIDQEVRDAFLDLQDTAQEVAVEKNAVQLATETLQQSRDRFASGVTDNIEVVQAQESLADANDAYIASLYRYNNAKVSLAEATGLAESNYALYLKGQ